MNVFNTFNDSYTVVFTFIYFTPEGPHCKNQHAWFYLLDKSKQYLNYDCLTITIYTIMLLTKFSSPSIS